LFLVVKIADRPEVVGHGPHVVGPRREVEQGKLHVLDLLLRVLEQGGLLGLADLLGQLAGGTGRLLGRFLGRHLLRSPFGGHAADFLGQGVDHGSRLGRKAHSPRQLGRLGRHPLGARHGRAGRRWRWLRRCRPVRQLEEGTGGAESPAGGAGLRVALGRVAAGKRRRVGLTQSAVDELAAVALLVETVRHIFVLLA